MMETIRIRRQGYPVRYEFAEFIDRYRVCIGGMPRSPHVADQKGAASKICQHVLKEDDWCLGGVFKLIFFLSSHWPFELCSDLAIELASI